MIYLELFLSFAQMGLLSFGGGYAVLPHIQRIIVEDKQWISMGEYIDVVAISQMTPGPIAINAATFVGNKVAGISGAITATLGCITPAIFICITLAWLYFKYKNMSIMKSILSGLRPVVIAFITLAAISIIKSALIIEGTQSLNYVNFMIFVVMLLIMQTFKKVDPIKLMVGSGFIYVALMLVLKL